MQPYQEATQEINRQQGEPGHVAKNLLLGGLGGGAFIGKIAPFLSKYIPEQMAIKGLSKASPKLGKFIGASMNQGYSFDSIKDFIGNKIENESQQPSQESRNIIEMESPELHQTLLDLIRAGKKPFEAALEVAKNKKFLKNIMKLEKQNKSGWGKIVQAIFGSEAVVPKSGLSRESLVAQGQEQQPQEPQGPGPGQQALMQIMQKINQRLGG